MEAKKNKKKKQAPNKGGRPELAENVKKKNRFSIQFSDIELQEIKEFLNENNFQKKLPSSSFFQEMVLNSIRNRPVISNSRTLNMVVVALNRIGNILNQIAKKANSINALSQNDVKKLNRSLDELTDTIGRL